MLPNLSSLLWQVLVLSFSPNYKDIRNALVSIPRAAFAAHVLARSPEFLEGRLARVLGTTLHSSNTWMAMYLLMWLTCASLLFIYSVRQDPSIFLSQATGLPPL